MDFARSGESVTPPVPLIGTPAQPDHDDEHLDHDDHHLDHDYHQPAQHDHQPDEHDDDNAVME